MARPLDDERISVIYKEITSNIFFTQFSSNPNTKRCVQGKYVNADNIIDELNAGWLDITILNKNDEIIFKKIKGEM